MTTAQNIVSKYGEPDKTYLDKFCMNWQVKKDFPWFPATEIFINKDFQLKLVQAFYNLQKNNLHTEIKTYDGCFNKRTVRGKTSESLHSWAMAIDLNASIEGLGQNTTHFSGQFIAIMKAAGIFWGGDWIHRKDPMHFALYNG